jgi:hypothetical protein
MRARSPTKIEYIHDNRVYARRAREFRGKSVLALDPDGVDVGTLDGAKESRVRPVDHGVPVEMGE